MRSIRNDFEIERDSDAFQSEYRCANNVYTLKER